MPPTAYTPYHRWHPALTLALLLASAPAFASDPVPAAPAPTTPTETPPKAALPVTPTPAKPSTPTSPTTPASIDLSAVETSVVHIRVRTDLGNGTVELKNGTGVYLGNGMVLTASHVVNRFTQIDIDFARPAAAATKDAPATQATTESHAFDPTVGKLVSYPRHDVSVLTGIQAPAWASAAKLAPKGPAVGDQVVSVGLTGEFKRRVRQGPVVDTTSMGKTFQVDAPTQKGDSGGPTFNASGEVVGVHSSELTMIGRLPDGKRVTRVVSVSYHVAGLELPKDQK